MPAASARPRPLVPAASCSSAPAPPRSIRRCCPGGVLNDGGSVVFNNAAAITETGTITGPGTVTVSGPGTVTLAGGADYTGGTTLSGGTLELGTAGAANSGGITFARQRRPGHRHHHRAHERHLRLLVWRHHRLRGLPRLAARCPRGRGRYRRGHDLAGGLYAGHRGCEHRQPASDHRPRRHGRAGHPVLRRRQPDPDPGWRGRRREPGCRRPGDGARERRHRRAAGPLDRRAAYRTRSPSASRPGAAGPPGGRRARRGRARHAGCCSRPTTRCCSMAGSCSRDSW